MCWKACLVFAISLSCSFDNIQAKRLEETIAYKQDSIDRLFPALTSALQYISQHVDETILDVLIGIRMVEGQLNALIAWLSADPSAGSSYPLHKVQLLQRLAFTVGRSTELSHMQDENFFNGLRELTDAGHWNFLAPAQNLSIHQPSVRRWEGMIEEDSDVCLRQLLGSHTRRCTVSKYCLLLMIRADFSGYSLSHQLLYFIVAKQQGCSDNLHRMLLSVQDLIESRCQPMFEEVSQIVESGFPVLRRDLFLEDVSLCGMMGYREFFHPRHLQVLFSWQNDNGCFAMNNSDYIRRGREQLLEDRRRMRLKRADVRLHDGCMAHMTTVAMVAMTQYLRYSLEEVGILGKVVSTSLDVFNEF